MDLCSCRLVGWAVAGVAAGVGGKCLVALLVLGRSYYFYLLQAAIVAAAHGVVAMVGAFAACQAGQHRLARVWAGLAVGLLGGSRCCWGYSARPTARCS